MSSPNDVDVLPPLPTEENWDPADSDDDLFVKDGERQRNKDDIYFITSILESAGVNCCFVGVKALQHFGARRIGDDVDICVPSTKMDDARRALLRYPDIFVPTKPRNQYDFTRRRHQFAWFQHIGVYGFYVLIPDIALGFSCVPSNIESGSPDIRIPYPTAAAWAEALAGLCRVNSGWRVELDDMVDGLLPTEQWVKEKIREEYRERLMKSIAGMKGRMSGKYSEERYISRFRRKPRPATQEHAVE